MRELWRSFQRLFVDALAWTADRLAFLGSHRWAAAIVLLTIVVRTLLLPLAIKQVRSMQAMARLQPELKRLQTKYRDDKQRLQQEVMELYKREGVNPFGSCLPLLAQMPVFFAMYAALRKLTTPRRAGGLGVSAMPFLGLGNLAQAASQSAAGWLLLAVMAVTSFLSARQTTMGQDPQQRRLMLVMPLFFTVVLVNFPAGLVLYWATQNVYQLVQQTIMLRGWAPPAASAPRTAERRGAASRPARKKRRR